MRETKQNNKGFFGESFGRESDKVVWCNWRYSFLRIEPVYPTQQSIPRSFYYFTTANLHYQLISSTTQLVNESTNADEPYDFETFQAVLSFISRIREVAHDAADENIK